MALSTRPQRQHAYGEDHPLTPIDRFGVWLSSRQIRRSVPDFAGKRVADVGCGYRATIARLVLDRVERLVLIDISLDPQLGTHPKVTAIEGWLPDALTEVPDASQDIVICNSVIEHLWEPVTTLREMERVLVPGGMLLLNVPSWRGKTFLEFTAFRLGSSPEEMDDHKMYYDPRDLWPLLVRAGFRPRDIRCFKHKFGLNTFARCHKAPARGAGGA
jgi:2-polyprenyl-3-methyl-5-hydroxy-6-metoxy-1,4-benzoquinol methylase